MKMSDDDDDDDDDNGDDDDDVDVECWKLVFSRWWLTMMIKDVLIEK